MHKSKFGLVSTRSSRVTQGLSGGRWSIGKNFAKLSVSLAALGLSLIGSTQVLNGGFESIFSDWQITGTEGYEFYGDHTTFSDPDGGSILAVFGAHWHDQYGEIEQSIHDLSGQQDVLSIDCGSDGLSLNNMTLTWNGAVLFNGPAPYAIGGALQTLSFVVVSDGHDTVEFLAWNSRANMTGLDNVRLTPANEPLSFILVGVGTASLLVRRRTLITKRLSWSSSEHRFESLARMRDRPSVHIANAEAAPRQIGAVHVGAMQ